MTAEFIESKETGQLVAVLRHEGVAMEWDCEPVACSGAYCDCTLLEVYLRPRDPASPHWPADLPDETAIRLDPLARSVYEGPTGDSGRQHPPTELERVFAEGLSDDGWDLLAARFIGTREAAIENVDPNDGMCTYEFEEVDEGWHVAFLSVFPFAPPVRMDVGGQEYYGVDSYCLDRGCRCTRAAIDLYSGVVDDRRRGYVELDASGSPPVYSFAVDTRSGKTHRAEPELGELPAAHGPPCRRLAGPNAHVLSTLRKRRTLLRKLYTATRRPAAQTLGPGRADVGTASADRVGRNSPCPCGSGKKHKRCCGR